MSVNINFIKLRALAQDYSNIIYIDDYNYNQYYDLIRVLSTYIYNGNRPIAEIHFNLRKYNFRDLLTNYFDLEDSVEQSARGDHSRFLIMANNNFYKITAVKENNYWQLTFINMLTGEEEELYHLSGVLVINREATYE